MIADLLPRLLPLLLVLGATFIYAGVTAGSNAYQIARGYDVSHTWETRERLVAVAGFVLLAYVPRGLEHWWNILAPLLAAGACACLFGLRFDIRLNLRRLLPRYYLGTDPQTAATDKRIRARGLTGRTFAWLKLGGVVVLAAAALLLSGCRTGRDVATGSAMAPVPMAPPTGKTMGTQPGTGGMATGLPMAPVAPVPPVPDAPRWQQRQYRKNLKAQPPTVPKKLAKGSTYQNSIGDNNQQQSTGKKTEGPTGQAAPDASLQQAQAAKNAQAAAGPGIVQTRTDVAAVPWWKRILSYWPWAVAGVAVWFFWPAILVLLRRLV